MKTPSSIEDTLIPMYEEDREALRAFRIKRNEHWARLRKAKAEYKWQDGFPEWIERTYGLSLTLNGQGNITNNYEIVDEKKYVTFLLKYS